MKRPLHDICKVFPALATENYDKLKASIKKSGCRVSVKVWKDDDGIEWVIDGGNRVKICGELGIDYPVQYFDGTEEEAVDYAIDLNMERRHLSPSQRAALAVEFVPIYSKVAEKRMKAGTLGPIGPRVGKATEHAAERVGASPRSVTRAKQVADNADPEVFEAVKDGTVSVSDAAAIATEPTRVQREAVEAVRNGHAKTARQAVTEGEASEEVIEDATGAVVPEKARAAFVTAKELSKICRELGSIVNRVEEIARGPGGRLIRFDSFKQQITDAKGNLWANRATHVCGYCKGKKAKCDACDSEGWTAKHVYEQTPGVK